MQNGDGGDLDADGFTVEAGDCDDTDPAVHPGASDTQVDGIDDDCDGGDGVDEDGDGYARRASGGHDCNDGDDTIHPQGVEVCDGRDNNCNDISDEGLPFATYHADADGDGYGDPDISVTACERPDGFTEDDTDCNDSTASQNPGNFYDYCDGVDNDCDSLLDEDSKADWELVTLVADTAYSVDPTTAKLTRIGTVPYVFDFNSADSRERGETLALGFQGQSLHTYDICDDTRELVGETGVTGGCGISFGPDGALYGILPGSNQLVRYDGKTGAASALAVLDVEIGYCGLTYDCTNDRLIGASSFERALFEIDPATGETSDLVELDMRFSAMGVDYDPQSRRVRLSNGESLFEVDLDAGDVTKIGDFPSDTVVNDLALMQTCE